MEVPIPSKPIVFSHWYHLIEGLQDSPQRFYTSLEEAIQRRQIPNISLSRVDYHEGGIFSAQREYLRVSRKEYLFDICVAPFGNGFFVSWWLGEPRPSPVLPTLGAIVGTALLLYYGGISNTIMVLIAAFFVVGALMSQMGEEEWVAYLLVIPGVGPLLKRLFLPLSYYRIDTALMFQESVHRAVLEVIDEITKLKGLRVLSEGERKPILSDLFKR